MPEQSPSAVGGPVPGGPGGAGGISHQQMNMMNKLHQCEIHMKKKSKHYNFLRQWLNKFPSRAKKIDVISRIVFPAVFAIFNLSYWCYYLLQEAKSKTSQDKA